MQELHLFIGNKCFSSWSLRAWIALKIHGIPFKETVIRLRQPETKANIRVLARSEKVPCLHHGSTVIWESLSILEYLAETFPELKFWPEERHARALARSISAEMHSGFADLRNEWGMNLRRKKTPKALAVVSPRRMPCMRRSWSVSTLMAAIFRRIHDRIAMPFLRPGP
jgi:glutathione S-transferase